MPVGGPSAAVRGSVLLGSGLNEITNYIEDDWIDDAATSSRSGTDDGVYAHPSSNQSGNVLIGRYRPLWNAQVGSPSASNDKFYIYNGETAAVSSNASIGDWRTDIDRGSADSGEAYFCFIAIGVNDTSTSNVSSNCYATKVGYDGSGVYNLVVIDGGTETTLVSSSPSNTSLTMRATRDAYGSFELFEGGTSQGTTTDKTHTQSDILQLNSNLVDTTNDIYTQSTYSYLRVE